MKTWKWAWLNLKRSSVNIKAADILSKWRSCTRHHGYFLMVAKDANWQLMHCRKNLPPCQVNTSHAYSQDHCNKRCFHLRRSLDPIIQDTRLPTYLHQQTTCRQAVWNRMHFLRIQTSANKMVPSTNRPLSRIIYVYDYFTLVPFWSRLSVWLGRLGAAADVRLQHPDTHITLYRPFQPGFERGPPNATRLCLSDPRALESIACFTTRAAVRRNSLLDRFAVKHPFVDQRIMTSEDHFKSN